MRILLLLLCVYPLCAKVLDQTATIAGMAVHYKVVLPNEFDPAKPYPAVLAFPPGSQTLDMVMTTLVRNWSLEAQKRGYIVVIPAAPGGRLFFQEGSRIFPEFLDKLLTDYKIRGNRFHVAGMSNGGRSAFFLAAHYPQYFLSVLGFPGYLAEATPERIQALSGFCVYMHVGEGDLGWREAMEAQARQFQAKGIRTRLTVEKGEQHVIGALNGSGSARLFEELEQSQKDCPR